MKTSFIKELNKPFTIPQGLPEHLVGKVKRLHEIEVKFKRREKYSRERKGDLDDLDYWRLQRRVTQVYLMVTRKKPAFDHSDLHKWSLEWYLKEVKHKKEYGKKRFETQYQFSPWFMQTSFGSDYGEFTCEECRYTFYHSPCRLYLAGKQLKNCLCGSCTNSYARSNDQTNIYH